MAIIRYKVLSTEKDGVELDFNEEVSLDASNIFYNDSNAQFDNIQDKVNQLDERRHVSYSFGRSGNSTSNTWLRKDGAITTNSSGFAVGLTNAKIEQVNYAARQSETFEILIYEHEGNSTNLTLLATLNVVSSTTQTFNTSISITKGKQLAVRVGQTSSGVIRDLGVDLLVTGEL